MTCPACGKPIPWHPPEERKRCPDPACWHIVTDAEESAARAETDAKWIADGVKDTGAWLWEDAR